MSEIILANTVESDRMGTVRKEERTMEINFVTARNGKIELMSDKTVVGAANDPELLANIMYDHGLADSATNLKVLTSNHLVYHLSNLLNFVIHYYHQARC